jgi:hypothetical protein
MMKKIHIIMSNHGDVALYQLLLRQLLILKELYDHVFLECVPCSLEGGALLSYLRHFSLCPAIDLTYFMRDS